LLYRGASTGQRLPIGTSGQILKVSSGGIPEWGAAPASGVTSVNEQTGAVTITTASIDAAEANHTHQPADVFADAAKVASSTAAFDGIYFRNGDDNGKGVYEDPENRNYFWWDSDQSKWLLANAADSNRFQSSSNTAFPWQAIGWTPISPQTGSITVAQANFYESSGAASSKSLLKTAKSGNAGSAQLVLGNDTRLTDSRQPTPHGSTHHTSGTDAIAPSNIGAAWALETRSHSFYSTSTYTLAQGRNVQLDVTLSANGATGTIVLPRLTTDSAQNGDDLFVRISNVLTNQTLVIQRYIWTGSSYLGSTETVVTATAQGAWRFRLLDGLWTLQPVANHTHTGSQVNVGTTANLPLRTGSGGVVEAGSFGTSAGSFCEGNDARLSDARTPSSTLAHKSSHAINGTDFLAPSDIGAQSIFVTEDLGTITANVTLTAARAKIYTVTVNTFNTPTPNVQLPTTNVQAGDVVQIRFTTFTGREMPVRNGNGSFLGSSLTNGQRATYIAASTSNDSWAEDGTNRHAHTAADITSGTLDVARLPNHTHVVADVTGAAASGSITTSGLTQATARLIGRTSSGTGAIEEIQIGGGLSLSAGELSSTVSAGIPATLLDAKGDLIVASAADTAARLAVGGTNGHVLTVDSNETLGVKWAAAAGGGSGGTKTYAVFTALDNQPTATAFATLDTRGTGIAVLDFDAATDESAVFVGVIPEGASLGSGLKVFIHWMASTATSGNCRWGVQFEKSGTDLDSDSFDTATEAHSAANGTSGIETVTEITATAIDSLAAGNRFRLKVFRNADDATNDTMTGDAELIAVEVRSAA
jgi:hypothetical protein